MLDRELQSAFGVFFREPAQEGGVVGTGRMVHGLFNHASAGSRGIDDQRGLSQSISWRQGLAPTGLLPSVQAMYDGHSHLDRWSVEVGKRVARDLLVTASPNGGWIRRGRTGVPHRSVSLWPFTVEEQQARRRSVCGS